MRHTILVTTLLGAAALAVGARQRKSRRGRAETGGTLGGAPGEGQSGKQAAAHEMRDYAYAEKAEFVVKMKKELVQHPGRLDQLGAKVESPVARQGRRQGQARGGA